MLQLFASLNGFCTPRSAKHQGKGTIPPSSQEERRTRRAGQSDGEWDAKLCFLKQRARYLVLHFKHLSHIILHSFTSLRAHFRLGRTQFPWVAYRGKGLAIAYEYANPNPF